MLDFEDKTETPRFKSGFNANDWLCNQCNCSR